MAHSLIPAASAVAGKAATRTAENDQSSSSSLRSRLLRRLLAPLLMLFCIDGATSYFLSLHYANSVYDGWLYDSASSLSLLVENDSGKVIFDLPPSARRLFEWDVVDSTYYSISGDRSGLISGRSDIPPPPASASNYGMAQVYDGVIDGDPVRISRITLPTASFDEVVTVVVAETLNKRVTLARNILASVLIPQLLLILVVVIAIRSGVLTGLEPLVALAKQLEDQDPEHPRPVNVAGVPSEVVPLTRSLNNLLERLDAAAILQRQFVADAAHQLRTPITALKLNVEQALHEENLRDIRVSLRESARAVDRIARISRQLLTLARTEPEAADGINFEVIDLCEIATEVGGQWVVAADAKRMELSLIADNDTVPVYGNRILLTEAISNLLDNAIRYHPGSGQIVIQLTGKPQPRLTICDDGNGIPPDQRNEVLKRFHRLSTNDEDGSGLGLAIVHDVVRLHGGRIRFSDGLNGRGIGIGFDLPTPADAPIKAEAARIAPSHGT